MLRCPQLRGPTFDDLFVIFELQARITEDLLYRVVTL